MRKTILFLLGIILVDLVISMPIYVKPLDGSGNIQADTYFNYTFNFTTDSACNSVVFSNISLNILTDSTGIGFIDLNISISDIPAYLCEYKNGALRKVHTLSDQIFKNIYSNSINVSNNISADWFKGKLNWSYIQNPPDILNFDNNTGTVNNSLLLGGNNLTLIRNHSLMNTIQGGSPNQYYHVNFTTYDYLIANLWNFIISAVDSWAGNYTSYYNKTEVDNNFTKYYLATNPSNFINTSTDSWKFNYTSYYNKTEVDNNLSLYAKYNFTNNNFNGSGNFTTTGSIGIGISKPLSQIHAVDEAGNPSRGIIVDENNNGIHSPLIVYRKSRGNSSSPTIVQDGDYAGMFSFRAYEGTGVENGYYRTAWFGALVNGSVAPGSVPMDLIFVTTGGVDDSLTNLDNVRMIIKSNGDIGMGTINPQFILDIQAEGLGTKNFAVTKIGDDINGAGNILRSARGTKSSPSATLNGDYIAGWSARGYGTTGFHTSGAARIQALAKENFTDTNKGSDLLFDTAPIGGGNAQTRLTIDNAGNVGIGTTSPTQRLDVRGTGNFSGTVYINNGTDISTFGTGSIGGSGTAGYIAAFNGTSSINNSVIYQNGSNVGIGTTAPSAKLDVRGVGNFSGTIYINNATDVSTLGGGNASWNESKAVGMFVQNNSGTAGYIPQWQTGNIINNSVIFQDGSNIGIGTESPLYKLDTSGSIRASSTIANADTYNMYSALSQSATTAGAKDAYAMRFSLGTTVTVNSSIYGIGVFGDLGNVGISSGVTDSGYRTGLYSEGYINNIDNRGTLSATYGTRVSSGIAVTGIGGKVNNAYGHYVRMFNDNANGTIDNAYGIYIEPFGTAGTYTNQRYAIYQAGAGDFNYFSGNIGIGTTSPTQKLDVRGNINVSQNITFGNAKAKLFSNLANDIMMRVADQTYSFTIYVNNTEAFKIIPKGSDDYIILNASIIEMSKLNGSGNAYLCVNGSGHLYRNSVSCA